MSNLVRASCWITWDRRSSSEEAIFFGSRPVAMFHRTLPLARDASIPPQQRIAKKVNAILTHLKKSG